MKKRLGLAKFKKNYCGINFQHFEGGGYRENTPGKFASKDLTV